MIWRYFPGAVHNGQLLLVRSLGTGDQQLLLGKSPVFSIHRDSDGRYVDWSPVTPVWVASGGTMWKLLTEMSGGIYWFSFDPLLVTGSNPEDFYTVRYASYDPTGAPPPGMQLRYSSERVSFAKFCPPTVLT